MTVAAGLSPADDTVATLTTPMVAVAAEPTANPVKPKPLASSPRLATTAPTRVLMTFMMQPFRLIPAHEPEARACPTWPPIIAA